ncbi:hypothetical protein [Variovorax paradoxus]|uniref:hypothetical protein n=1 Tax=Variovorax paradoxus TaxID=34073 RepID=UPI00247FFCE9|nr:hypothetical protein [Variovorax paradoxus]WGT62453.1 hypothetical protein QHG62_20695 [Variovorax paradoxus]
MPLLFLMRLLQTELPVRVVQPEEIRHVSVLLATGLIVAEISGLEPTGLYAAPRMATVIAITDEGRAEIAKLGKRPELAKTTMQFSNGLRLM